MPINIKDPGTDELARRLADRTGESITVAVRTAMQERMDRLEGRQHRTLDELHAYIERGRARRMLDARSAEEIIGWDQDGMPQ
ncbi:MULTISPECIES: type II toxin-antitoxin system VapB family antitoxin [unclassified Luteococcus]|uniref:type II toxin-antitoxin system VapB family antitoxin n=1 Tax=unclassified Luteococcus TaxID=2639923 RepID=UPI00313CDD35